jgi:hypothetical protein
MLLRSLLNQSQSSMIQATGRKVRLKRTAKAGRDKEIWKMTGEKLTVRKGYLLCSLLISLGALLSDLKIKIRIS